MVNDDLDVDRRWYEQTMERIAAALEARMQERERIEDRLHQRPLLGEELEQLEDEVDAALAVLPLPDWRVEGLDDAPWLTWRQGDQAAFLAVVDWALDEGVLAFEDEVRLCRAALPAAQGQGQGQGQGGPEALPRQDRE